MKESDIRPEALLKRYLELSAQDADACFRNAPKQEIPCVACGSSSSTFQFRKNGFAYATCNECGTLFQSPRPSIEAFEAFYRTSESSRYWADVFFPAVAEVRREKIFRPRVERLSELCSQLGVHVKRLIEVGAGFGVFLDEWRRCHPEVDAIAIEPSHTLAEQCRSKGFQVVEDIVENVRGCDGHGDLIVCFEVLEHAHDARYFLETLSRLAKPNGYVFVSTLGIDGFDLQVLWEKSNSIFPPHHINFMSVRGFNALFRRAGLVDIVITTPGQLDVDIVRNASERDNSVLASYRFLRHILNSPQQSVAFQEFLVANNLSSHTWVLGRKPAEPPG